MSAFRRPGAEIKEGLIPVNMFYMNQSLTDNLSAEGFYQIGWDSTVTDNCGTFFSQSDIVSHGCNNNLRVLNSSATLSAAQQAGLRPLGVDINGEGVLVRRTPDQDPSSGGQFGFAMHYNFEPLDTEFGAYFMNYHSRAPIFSAKGASQAVFNTAPFLGTAAPPGGGRQLQLLHGVPG